MKFKIRPRLSECRTCMETAIRFDAQPHCSECNTEIYDALKLEGDYVYYIKNNKIKRIHMNYVLIKENE